ncbi:MAG: hypothetical protein IT340_20085 [Chloroflexi bacterium]|nr:hypothetical protein [Chloroflexota bacterium]
MQEALHANDDQGGYAFGKRSATWRNRVKAEMRDILVRLGQDTPDTDAALDVLAASTAQEPPVVAWLDSQGRSLGYQEGLEDADEDADHHGYRYPPTLQDADHASKVEVYLALRHSTVDPATTPVTDQPEADADDDRSANFLFTDLWMQPHRWRRQAGSAALDLLTFAQWVAARSLLRGFNRVRDFAGSLLADFPQAALLNVPALTALARSQRLSATHDAAAYIAAVLAVDSNALLAINAMVEHYGDMVRATRSAPEPTPTDLPEVEPTARGGRYLRRISHRVAAVYRRTNSARMTARAFGCRNEVMEDFLVNIGAKAAGRPATYRTRRRPPAA